MSLDTSILKAFQNQTNYFDKSPEEAEEFSPSAFCPVLEGLIAVEKNIDYNVKIHRTYSIGIDITKSSHYISHSTGNLMMCFLRVVWV